MLKLLDEVRRYIEETEQTMDGEWGSCRTAQELIDQGDMPDIYAKVLAAIERETRREYVRKLLDEVGRD